MADKDNTRIVTALKTLYKRVNRLNPEDYGYDEDDRTTIEGASKMKESALAEIECLIDSYSM